MLLVPKMMPIITLYIIPWKVFEIGEGVKYSLSFLNYHIVDPHLYYCLQSKNSTSDLQALNCVFSHFSHHSDVATSRN